MTTPEQRIDEALDSVLRSAGTSKEHYANHGTLEKMREAMRNVMQDSYIAGSNDNFNAMQKSSKRG